MERTWANNLHAKETREIVALKGKLSIVKNVIKNLKKDVDKSVLEVITL